LFKDGGGDNRVKEKYHYGTYRPTNNSKYSYPSRKTGFSDNKKDESSAAGISQGSMRLIVIKKIPELLSNLEGSHLLNGTDCARGGVNMARSEN